MYISVFTPWSVLGISSTLEVAAAGWGNEVGDNFCSHRISLESFSDGGWSWQCDNGEEGDVSASIHPAEANAPITACTAARFSGIMHPDSPVSWEENPCNITPSLKRLWVFGHFTSRNAVHKKIGQYNFDRNVSVFLNSWFCLFIRNFSLLLYCCRTDWAGLNIILCSLWIWLFLW